MTRVVEWLRDPENRVTASYRGFFTCAVAWPVTSLTILSDEPQGVLALSWMAIMIQLLLLIVTTEVHRDQLDTTDE